MHVLRIAALVMVFSVGTIGQPIAIGITQIVDHPALNAVRDGIIAVLREAGYIEGQNVRFILANAQRDFSVAIAIAQNFRAQEVGLVVSIATPTSQAVVQVFQGTTVPVVFSAVTDPVRAGLTVFPNVTGTSDMIDVAGDLALLKELVPGLRRVGMVFNPGEVNSAILTRMAQDAAPKLGLTIVTAAAESTAGVLAAAQSLVGRVDAVYVTTDNTVATALEAVIQVTSAAKIPFLMADPTSLERGALVCTGHNYYEHGRLTGEIVVRVLRGEKPGQIPVVYQTGGRQVLLNLDVAAAMGFTFPQALLDRATGVLLGGQRFVRGR